jgi:hypothetical protein
MPPKTATTCNTATDAPQAVKFDPFNLNNDRLRDEFSALLSENHGKIAATKCN